MPLDGTTPWPQPNRWTIKVGLAPRLLAESRHWSHRKRRVFHRLAADAAYAAIDAIQLGHLRKHRDAVSRRGSWARYYFRVERRTIIITVSDFHFHDPRPSPDPDGGSRSPVPVDLLILQVSGRGRQYSIDRVEGILPLPPRPARNSIISLFEQIRLARGKLRSSKQERNRNGSIAPIVETIGGTIHYSPQRMKFIDRSSLDSSSLYQARAAQAMPQAYWASRLQRAFKALGLFRNGDAAGGNGEIRKLRRFTYSPESGAYIVIEGSDPTLSREIAQLRLQLPNHPTRPNGFQ